jgi:NitT/TauT family transport system substrate-binding protein
MRFAPGGVSLRNGKKPLLRAPLCMAVASGLAVLGAAGCSSSGGPGGTVSSAITIVAIPGVDNAPLKLAQHDNLFAAAGLQNVHIVYETSAASEFAALKDNQAQIAAADYGDIFYNQFLYGGYRILANGYDATSGSLEVLTLAGSGINSPADLAGVRVGVPNDDVLLQKNGNPVSLETIAATKVLSDYTAAANSVIWDPMSQPTEVSELLHHRIRAILVSEPYIFEAESQAGAVEVMDAASGYTTQFPISGYISTSGWVKTNPAAVADFQAAMAQAQAQASVVGPIQKVLPGYTGMSMEDADLSTIGTYPTSTSASQLTRVEKLMWESGVIGQQVDVPPMVVP